MRCTRQRQESQMSTPREIRNARRLAGAQFRPFDCDDSPEDKVEAAADFDPYFTDTDDEPGICPTCNGSGEGMFDGATCSDCRGRGER